VAHQACASLRPKHLHAENHGTLTLQGAPMLQLATKAINRWRKLYHLNRHAKRVTQRPATVATLPYNDTPRVSAVVQLFNKRQNIEAIVAGLLSAPIDEIIVLDDGSSDGSIDVLPGLLTGKNHFVIRSNDIFEVRTYHRALDFARGEFVALLQDDDIPPMDGAWVRDAIDLFDRHPRLAVLGGRDALELFLKDPSASADPPNPIGYRAINQRDGHRIDIPFAFAQVVNRAPILLRRQPIREIGGIDLAFAPFQCDDVDLCLRAWKAGLQVGFYATGFVRDVGMGGMRLFNADKMGPQSRKNWGIIFDRYASDIARGRFAAAVAEAQEELLVAAR
jgi:glycosyltransferase involved in cell wall biosynthesis